MESNEYHLKKVKTLLHRVEFTLFGVKLFVNAECDKIDGSRVYIQVYYAANCTKTGVSKVWFGRKWYLSKHMLDDEVVKTSWCACKAVIEHEVMEAFKVDGKILFNPHTSFEDLLTVSDREVRRADGGKDEPRQMDKDSTT